MNQRAQYVIQFKYIVRTHMQTHTHRTDCSIWTNRLVGKYLQWLLRQLAVVS